MNIFLIFFNIFFQKYKYFRIYGKNGGKYTPFFSYQETGYSPIIWKLKFTRTSNSEAILFIVVGRLYNSSL